MEMNMKNKMTVQWVIGVTLVTVMLGLPVATQAAMTWTADYTGGTQTAYAASATDLANNDQATFDSIVATDYDPVSGFGAVGTQNDGATGSATTSADGMLDNGSDPTGVYYSVTITFDTATNTNGYNITEINTIAAWADNRTSQRYEVWYSVVGSGSLTQLGSSAFSYEAADTAGSSRIRIYDDAAGNILTGVDQIELRYERPISGDANSEGVYREIDVFGAAVPEPATMGLLAMGAGGLLLRRRRR
jgi:hypothetical protein